MKSCENCGKPLDMNARFCQSCGAENTSYIDEYEELSALVVRIQGGDTAAFDEFYLKLQKYVRFQAKNILKRDDLAEDVVQEVFISAYNNINSLQDTRKVKSWIKTITYNTALNQLKKEQPYQLIDDEEDQTLDNEEEKDTMLLPENAYDSKELRALFVDFMNELPVKQKIALEGFYFEGKKISEIAGESGIPEATVKTSLARGKKNLEKTINAWSEKTGQKLYSIAAAPVLYFLFRSLFMDTAVTAAVPPALWEAVSGSSASSHSNPSALTNEPINDAVDGSAASPHSNPGVLSNNGVTTGVSDDTLTDSEGASAQTAGKAAGGAAAKAGTGKIIAIVAAVIVAGGVAAAVITSSSSSRNEEDMAVSDMDVADGSEIYSGSGEESESESVEEVVEIVLTDEEQIEEVFATFVEGCKNLDEELVRTCFSEDMLEYFDFYYLELTDQYLYHDQLGSNFDINAQTDFTLEVTGIEIDGTRAIATLNCTDYEGETYECKFEMTYEDGAWKLNDSDYHKEFMAYHCSSYFDILYYATDTLVNGKVSFLGDYTNSKGETFDSDTLDLGEFIDSPSYDYFEQFIYVSAPSGSVTDSGEYAYELEVAGCLNYIEASFSWYTGEDIDYEWDVFIEKTGYLNFVLDDDGWCIENYGEEIDGIFEDGMTFYDFIICHRTGDYSWDELYYYTGYDYDPQL